MVEITIGIGIREIDRLMNDMNELFISYSRNDSELRQEFDVAINLLKRQGLVATWYDARILAGEDWSEAIAEHLESAKFIVLLISPDFVASDFCWSNEMQIALRRSHSGKAIVIPVLLRSLDNWECAPFAKNQVLPRNGIPVTSWKNRDEAWQDVVKGIRTAIASSERPGRISLGSALTVSVLVDSRHEQLKSEFLEIARLAALDFKSCGARVNLAIHRATEEMVEDVFNRGVDIFVFLGLTTEDGQLVLEDGYFKMNPHSETWCSVQLALIFAPNGAAFSRGLPCSWLATKGPDFSHATRGFLSTFIDSIKNFGIFVALEIAEKKTRALLRADFPFVSKVKKVVRDQEVAVEEGACSITTGSAAIFGTFNFDFAVSAIETELGFSPGYGVFVGRRKELDHLLDLPSPYVGKSLQRVVWVHGSPGMGKSALVRRFATKVRDELFYEQSMKVYVLYLSCHHFAHVDDLLSALIERCRILYILKSDVSSINDLFVAILVAAGRAATHVWILDDLSYLATSPDSYEEAARVVYLLREMASATGLCWQLVVSSRRPGPKTIPAISVESLARTEAVSLAVAIAVACKADNITRQDTNFGAPNLLKLTGSTVNFVRSLFLAIDRGVSFQSYAEELARGVRQSTSSHDEVSKKMLNFELEQLRGLEAKHGFRYTAFLESLYPLVCRAGSFTVSEVESWFGRSLLSSGFGFQASIFQSSIEYLVRIKFLSVEEKKGRLSYSLPPNQRWNMRAIASRDEISPNVPRRGAKERLSIALEGLAYAQHDAIEELILLGIDYQGDLDDPDAATAYFYSMLVRAELLSDNVGRAVGLLDEIVITYDGLGVGKTKKSGRVFIPVSKAYISKGMKLSSVGRSSEALATFDALIERMAKASFEDQRGEIAALLAKARVEKAGILEQSGNIVGSIEILEELESIYLHTSDPSTLRRLSRLAFKCASSLVISREFIKAREIYSRFCSILSGQQDLQLIELLVKGLYDYGTMEFRLGDLHSAKAILAKIEIIVRSNRVQNISDVCVSAMCLLGHVGWAIGDRAGALNVFDIAIKQFGTLREQGILKKVAIAVLNRGLLLWDCGLTKDALVEFDRLTAESGHFSSINSSTTTIPIAFTRKLELLVAMSDHDSVIVEGERVLRAYANHQHPMFLDLVATARYHLSRAWLSKRKFDFALSELCDLENALSKRFEPASCILLAKCVYEKSQLLFSLGRTLEAQAACAYLVARLGDVQQQEFLDILEASKKLDIRLRQESRLDLQSEGGFTLLSGESPVSQYALLESRAQVSFLDDSLGSITYGERSYLDYEHYISDLRSTLDHQGSK